MVYIAYAVGLRAKTNVAQRLQSLRCYSAPRKKLPDRRIDIFCNTCNQYLFRYAKGNGTNSQLVKIYHERITQDFTDGSYTNCPSCDQQFAREAMIHGRRASKIISGKIKIK